MVTFVFQAVNKTRIANVSHFTTLVCHRTTSITINNLAKISNVRSIRNSCANYVVTMYSSSKASIASVAIMRRFLISGGYSPKSAASTSLCLICRSSIRAAVKISLEHSLQILSCRCSASSPKMSATTFASDKPKASLLQKRAAFVSGGHQNPCPKISPLFAKIGRMERLQVSKLRAGVACRCLQFVIEH